MPAVASDWLVWQLVDSAFPTGGFAHSWGLESAWHHGEIGSVEDLHRFVRATVMQAGYGVLPLLTEAHRHPDRLSELDALAEAFLTSVVANRASRIQGRTLLSTCGRVWPGDALTALERQSNGLCLHVAPITGALFRALGVPLHTAQRCALLLAARGVLSAAVRLGIVGAFEAQRLQHTLGADLDGVLERCAARRFEDIAQTAPIQELLQSAHGRLYSRLFQS